MERGKKQTNKKTKQKKVNVFLRAGGVKGEQSNPKRGAGGCSWNGRFPQCCIACFYSFIKRILILSILFYSGVALPQHSAGGMLRERWGSRVAENGSCCRSAAAAGITWGPQDALTCSHTPQNVLQQSKAVTAHPCGTLCCAARCCSHGSVCGCGGE